MVNCIMIRNMLRKFDGFDLFEFLVDFILLKRLSLYLLVIFLLVIYFLNIFVNKKKTLV